ncbi:diguanylate cyclase [Desulfopila aestuarii]|uniref:diguanylate cyclase n=1 Tax=Desulfopila aestuarii DSM 18488 TaxID=1121416 RepID=A0A1M7YGG3_9BACT|nr:diguanylate cyclase [Desulfopila aestuarii]SHO51676.1 diguanylate cyclase (GGDEF) domain-containing protein [Desulfopila aestuarii DSM 18488]
METIRAAIIDRRSTAKNDEDFIDQLNMLIKDHGDVVCPIIFTTLTSIDLPPKVAKKYWFDVQNHRLQMIQQLGRNITLTTAIADYLQSFTNHLHKSYVVDAGAFERAVSGTILDNLTGLYNRPYFDETYEQQIALARRYTNDLSILFLDIDDFKDINDNFGHLAGDYALQRVAEVIRNNKRESDIAVRYGGEEFVLLMPNTACVDAAILAERIRCKIEELSITINDNTFQLTISGGLASYPLNSLNAKDLLFMADSAVYLAKGSGKNTISQFREEQRRFLRVKINRPILIKELGFEDHHVFSAESKDIGLGGILLENDTLLPLGSMHEMSIAVNGHDDKLLLLGKVVRVEEITNQRFNIGLSFSFKEMAKEASNHIANFLKDYTLAPHQTPHAEPLSH